MSVGEAVPAPVQPGGVCLSGQENETHRGDCCGGGTGRYLHRNLCPVGGRRNVRTCGGLVGYWNLYAIYDRETERTRVGSDASYYIEFRADKTAPLQSGGDLPYECQWSFDEEKSDGEDRYYDMEYEEVVDFSDVLTELNREDNVLIEIPYLQYGMVFQRS